MRELNIDWHALHSAVQMNMPEIKCFLSLEDGRVLKLPPGDPSLPEVRADREHFAPIEAIPSRIQYQWLDEFIKAIEDDALRERMEAAINGKGAFRRFKDILLTLPDERRRWFEFRDQMMRQRVVDWVRELGVQPTNDPPWVGEAAPLEHRHQNNPHDIEALRDFLIEWVEPHKDDDLLSPLSLERLAQSIGERFRVRPKK